MGRFDLSPVAIDVAALVLSMDDARAGAFTSFEGRVRNHNEGRAVRGLRYEAYEALARTEGQRIVDEACGRFEVCGIVAVHRVGELEIGDVAVWVGVTAAHRDAAFAACRHVIDEIKVHVPIWKHEVYAQGAAQWLHPE